MEEILANIDIKLSLLFLGFIGTIIGIIASFYKIKESRYKIKESKVKNNDSSATNMIAPTLPKYEHIKSENELKALKGQIPKTDYKYLKKKLK